MTVREYLEMLNNCKISDGMDAKLINLMGFTDIVPSDFFMDEYGYSEVETEKIEDNKIVVIRKYNTRMFGEMPFSKTTLLDDPLGQHGFLGYSESEIIDKTISSLRNIVENEKRKETKSKIPWEDALKNFEEYVFNNENNMKNGL